MKKNRYVYKSKIFFKSSHVKPNNLIYSRKQPLLALIQLYLELAKTLLFIPPTAKDISALYLHRITAKNFLDVSFLKLFDKNVCHE